MPSSNQVTWIAGSLFVGFFVFITIRGQLPAFQAAIFKGPAAKAAAPATGATAAPAATAPTVAAS